MNTIGKSAGIAVLLVAMLAASAAAAGSSASANAAQLSVPAIPDLTVSVGNGSGSGKLSVPLQILLLLTVLSIVPALLMMTTCFTRIVVVLSFVRQALGTQQLPPNQLILGLALILTIFTMTPVWNTVKSEALDPWQSGEIGQEEALARAQAPIRAFMLKQTREKDLALFVEMTKTERPKSIDDVPTSVIIPSFMISELRNAFQMGFVLYLPFLVIDMVVASVLMSMGMMMLPPIMISLPFKVLLFVLVDGWYLIVKSLVVSFQ